MNDGLGLNRAQARTIGVDPAYKITSEVCCDLKLVRSASDDFFARDDALSHFPEGLADLTFIDGMHLFEFALRDFMNTERCSGPNSVVIFDDVLPRQASEAARNRHTRAWTGDVFKIIPVLERFRPDLVVIPIDTEPTGLLLVLGLDPASTVLTEHYDEIIAEYVVDDPQVLPPEILHRRTAADPYKLIASGAWTELAAARDSGGDLPASVAKLGDLRGTARYVSNPPDPGVWGTAPATTPAAAKPVAPTRTLSWRARRELARLLDPRQ